MISFHFFPKISRSLFQVSPEHKPNFLQRSGEIVGGDLQEVEGCFRHCKLQASSSETNAQMHRYCRAGKPKNGSPALVPSTLYSKVETGQDKEPAIIKAVTQQPKRTGHWPESASVAVMNEDRISI